MEESLRKIFAGLCQAFANGLSSVTINCAGDEQTVPINHTSVRNLKIVRFEFNGDYYKAIEQNPETGSPWATKALEGHRVVQLLADNGKYIAVSDDGNITEYPV